MFKNALSEDENQHGHQIRFTSVLDTHSNEWQRNYKHGFVLCVVRYLKCVQKLINKREITHKNHFFLNFSTENVDITLIVKTKFEKRNGKDYLTISDISTKCDAQHIKINLKYRNTATLINDIINRVANANWKMFKRTMDPSINKFVSQFVKQMGTPMFNELAFQDFIHM